MRRRGVQTGGMLEPPYLRCSDADRDRAAAVLRDSLAEGRIAMTELDGRLDQVYRAQTYGELGSVMADLPAWAANGAAPPAAPWSPPMPFGTPVPPAGRRTGRNRRYFTVAAVVWILFLTAASSAPRMAAPMEPLLFFVAIWGFIALGRRHRHPGRSRRLPPPRR